MNWSNLFSKQENLINHKTKELTEFSIDLGNLKTQLKEQFESLYTIASQTDESFIGAVKAQEAKQNKGLENLEKRLLRAQKRKLSDILNRITDIQNDLFPNQSLQERQTNFSEFYLENGESLIPMIINQLKPLENKFDVITL